MFLENDKLKLRALEPEDLKVLYEWENDSRLWIHGNTLNPYSKQTLRQYITDSLSQDIYQNKQLRLMIDMKTDNKTIGTVDLYDFDVRNLKAGIGILIDEDYRKQNIASNTLELIKSYAFSFLHMHQLYAFISVDNEPSIKLFEKAGFGKSGTLKEWICFDNKYKAVHIYQIINTTENE